MEIWIPITIFAAFAQSARSALQKHLTSSLSTAGATQARFFFAVPFALLYVAVLHFGGGIPLPALNLRFVAFAVTGGLAQVLATVLFVQLFSYRNLFVGTAFSKTETIQTAVLGFVVLGDTVSVGAVAGMAIGVVGVIVISAAHTAKIAASGLSAIRSRATLLGLGVGFFFGIAASSFRGASLSLDGGYLIQAAVTLAFVLTLQAVLIAVWLVIREPGQMTAMLKNSRVAALVGLAGMVASAGWFSAMTLVDAATVKAVGQVELVFAFVTSVVLFRERPNALEIGGIALITIGIVVLLQFR